MKYLAILNFIIVLFINYFLIESIIYDFGYSSLVAIFLYLIFLIILNMLAIFIYFKKNKIYSKYLYPIELGLCLFLMSFQYITIKDCYDSLYDLTFKSTLEPIEVLPINEKSIGPIEKIINIKIPEQNLMMTGKITTYFKGNFEDLEVNKSIFKASKYGFINFTMQAFPFLFFHNWNLVTNVDITYNKIDVTLLDVFVKEYENEKTITIKYSIACGYVGNIDYLRKCYDITKQINTKIEEKEISYNFIKKEYE